MGIFWRPRRTFFFGQKRRHVSKRMTYGKPNVDEQLTFKPIGTTLAPPHHVNTTRVLFGFHSSIQQWKNCSDVFQPIQRLRFKSLTLLPSICFTNFATKAADAVFGQYASFMDDKHACHAEFRRWQFKWEHEEPEPAPEQST